MDAHVCLASASPRRRALLAALGIRCDVVPADVDETPRAAESPADYVLRLALAKARAAAAHHTATGHVLLAADTAVVVDGDILGKPTDAEDAARMLARLAGRDHDVLTGVAVRWVGGERTALSHSRVWFRALRDGEAQAYWRTGEPADKAGGYAIQGFGALFVRRLEGSYSGVVGLPLFETGELLAGAGCTLLDTRP